MVTLPPMGKVTRRPGLGPVRKRPYPRRRNQIPKNKITPWQWPRQLEYRPLQRTQFRRHIPPLSPAVCRQTAGSPCGQLKCSTRQSRVSAKVFAPQKRYLGLRAAALRRLASKRACGRSVRAAARPTCGGAPAKGPVIPLRWLRQLGYHPLRRTQFHPRIRPLRRRDRAPGGRIGGSHPGGCALARRSGSPPR